VSKLKNDSLCSDCMNSEMDSAGDWDTPATVIHFVEGCNCEEAKEIFEKVVDGKMDCEFYIPRMDF